MGSSEQLPDSDSELDDSSNRVYSLTKQESVVSTDDDQLTFWDNEDLSTQSALQPCLDQDPDQEDQENSEEGDPPALPESAPPEEEAPTEQDLTASLAELNVNQSNNKHPLTPTRSLSGLPLTRLCGKKLALTKKRNSEPEFV